MTDSESIAGDAPASRRQAPPSRKCFLCEDILPQQGRLKRFKKCDFHTACWDAARCHRRLGLLSGADPDSYMLNRTDEWRADVRPLVRQPGCARDTTARNAVRRRMGTIREYSGKAKVRKRLLLNRRRYKSYRQFWDRATSSQASSDFEEFGKRQNWAYSKDREQRVAISDNEHERETEGFDMSYIVEESMDCRPVAATSAGSTGAPRPRERRVLADRPRRDEAFDRPRKRAAPSVGSAPSPSPPRARMRMMDRRRDVSAACSATSAPSLATARSIRQPEADSDDGDDDSIAGGPDDHGSRVSAQSPPQMTTPRDKLQTSDLVAPATMTPCQFLQEKITTKRAATQLLAEGRGHKSIKSRIATTVAKLSAADIAQMDTTPQSTLEDLNKADENLAQATLHIEKARSDNWASIRDQVTTMSAYVQAARAHGELELKALLFLLEQQRAQSKAVANSERHRKDKTVNALYKRGGFPKPLARFLGPRVDEYSPPDALAINPEQFDHTSPTLWTAPPQTSSTAASSEGGDPAAEGEAAAQPPASEQQVPQPLEPHRALITSIGNLDTKLKSLQGNLAENTNWSGAMVKLEMTQGGVRDLPGFADSELLDMPGSHPWLVGQRPLAFRCGPASTALPGVGALIFPLTDNHDFFVIMCPIAEILSKGICLADAFTFFGTDGGISYMESSALVVKIPSGATLWCPYGYLPVPVAFKHMTDEEFSKGAAARLETVFFSIFATIANEQWAKSLPTATWSAIMDNRQHLQKLQDKKAWFARGQFFDAFAKKVCPQ